MKRSQWLIGCILLLSLSSIALAQDSVPATFMGFNPENPLYIRLNPEISGYPTDYLAAGQMRFEVAGNLQPAYCIEIAAHLYRDTQYTAMQTPLAAGFPQDNIAYILTTQDNLGVTKDEGAALQAAIWKLVYSPDQLVFNNSSIDAAANDLVAASLGQARPLACSNAELTLTLKGDSDNLLHGLVTLAQAGQVISDQEISFFHEDTFLGSAPTTSDGSLDYQFSLPADETVTITAKTSGHNIYLLGNDNYQDVITYEECTLTAQNTFTCADKDADGICDTEDNCPSVANADQADSDTDAIGNACDNCVKVANADQADGDADAIGNACDNCVKVANFDQANRDGDAFGNACDNCVKVTNSDQANSDGDAFGNACDNCVKVANSDQANSDGDAFGDVCDMCPLDPTNDADHDGVCGTKDCHHDDGNHEDDHHDDGDHDDGHHDDGDHDDGHHDDGHHDDGKDKNGSCDGKNKNGKNDGKNKNGSCNH